MEFQITNFDDPEMVLKHFLTAMHSFECRWYEEIGTAPAKDVIALFDRMREEKLEILRQYCTDRKRVYSEYAGSVGDPPEYDPNDAFIAINHETRSRITIEVQQLRGFKNRLLFVLLRKSDRWLIDSKKWKKSGEKWDQGIL